MQFLCQNIHFNITNPILLSSQTIKHLQLDCDSDTGAIIIPDVFLDVINYSLMNIPDIKIFEKNLKLLEFYDYLNVDEKYIKYVSNIIGVYVENSQPDLTLIQQNILLKYYPILNYYEKYGDSFIGEDLPKYVTPYYHKNIKSYNIRIYCEYGNLNMVKYLVSMGENIKEHTNFAVILAIKNGHLEIVKYLLESNVSQGANIRGNNNMALMHASKNGHLEVVKYLIESDVSKSKLADKNRAVIFASENGHLEVIKYLAEVSKGANINDINNFAVKIASENGHIEVVKYLTSKGAGANIKDWVNKAVSYASKNGHLV